MKRTIILLLSLVALLPLAAQKTENKLNSEYAAAIRQYLQDDIANRQRQMQKSAKQILLALPNEEKLYNEDSIIIRTSLVDGKREDGTTELNYVFEISYNCRHLEGFTDDYPLGRFDWDSSNSCRAICTLTKHFVEGVLDDIFRAGKQVTATIYSTTDGVDLASVIPYSGQYGDFRYCPVNFNGEELRISVDRTSGIRNNCQLAYIRAQSVRQFLQTNIRNLTRTNNDFVYITNSYSDTGSRYRRSSIELVVHDAFRETIDLMTADKIQDDYVDFNIPQSTSSYDNAYVLVIANEDYDNNFLPSVPFATNDGEIVCQYFVRALGIPERQVKLLRNATREEIITDGIHWLTDLSQAVAEKNGETTVAQAHLFVYYAGHGIVDFDGNPYIIPNHIDPDGIKALQNGGKSSCCLFGKKKKTSSVAIDYDIALSRRETARLLPQCLAVDTLCAMLRAKDKRNPYPVATLTVILDAGFDGHQRTGALMLRPDRNISPNAKPTKRKANKNSDAIVLLAAACDKTAFSFDTQHHGFLTYFLLKEIKSSASSLTHQTYQDIFESVQRNLGKESALQGKWQEISGYVDGKHASDWQRLPVKN